MIDLVIDQVNCSTEANVKNILIPICKDLNSRSAIIETVLRDECESEDEAGADVGAIGPLAQGELIVSSIVQNCMKKYSFKQNRFKVHSSDDPKGAETMQLMQPDASQSGYISAGKLQVDLM